MSLASTLTVTAVSDGRDGRSLIATGGRLAAITVIDTVAVAVPPRPSLIVYVNESGPEYPAVGV